MTRRTTAPQHKDTIININTHKRDFYFIFCGKIVVWRMREKERRCFVLVFHKNLTCYDSGSLDLVSSNKIISQYIPTLVLKTLVFGSIHHICFAAPQLFHEPRVGGCSGPSWFDQWEGSIEGVAITGHEETHDHSRCSWNTSIAVHQHYSFLGEVEEKSRAVCHYGSTEEISINCVKFCNMWFNTMQHISLNKLRQWTFMS